MALRYENEVNEIVGYDENGVKLACVQFPAGVGGELMEQLAKRLRDEKKKAVLTCPYAQHWFDGHPENKDLVAE